VGMGWVGWVGVEGWVGVAGSHVARTTDPGQCGD